MGKFKYGVYFKNVLGEVKCIFFNSPYEAIHFAKGSYSRIEILKSTTGRLYEEFPRNSSYSKISKSERKELLSSIL